MPIARVQMPDGRIGRFEVPEGMTPEQIEQLATRGEPQVNQIDIPNLSQMTDEQLDAVGNAPIPQEKSVLSGIKDALTSREALRAYGGTAGSVAPFLLGAARTAPMGAGLGPVGMAGAGLLGGIGGVLAGDLVRDVANPEEAPKTVEQYKERAIGASGQEATAQAIGAILPAAVKPFAKIATKITGAASEGAKDLVSKAKEFGIDLAPANLKDNAFVQGWKEVFGVMPFSGKPFTTTAKTQAEQTQRAANAILDDLAPNKSMFDAGTDLVKAAENSSKEFRKEASNLYKAFETKATSLPEGQQAAFKSDAIRAEAEKLFAKRDAGTIGGVPQLAPEPVQGFIDGLRSAPSHLSIQQLQGLNQDVNGAIAQRKLQGADVSELMGIKKAIENSMRDVDEAIVGKDVAQDLVSSLKVADQFYAQNIGRFQSATGKKFGKVDKNLFKVGFDKPGSVPDDQAMRAIFDAGSPQSLKELRSIVGDKAYSQASRSYLDSAFKGIVKDEGGTKFVDPSELTKKLKLDTEEGKQVMRELMAGSKVPAATIDKFMDVVEAVARVQPSDPSRFVQRRAVMGGLGSLGLAGGAYGLGSIPTASLFYLANRFSNALANPKVLNEFAKTQGSKIPERMKYAALVRMVNGLYGKEEAKKLNYDNLVTGGEAIEHAALEEK